jgi:hypothetical protein
MAHAQKPDFVFRRNGRVHLNRQGASVQSTAGNRGVRISVSNAGYTTFRGSVKSTGYPFHLPVFPSLLLPCVTVCHHISTEIYLSDCVKLLYIMQTHRQYSHGTTISGTHTHTHTHTIRILPFSLYDGKKAGNSGTALYKTHCSCSCSTNSLMLLGNITGVYLRIFQNT